MTNAKAKKSAKSSTPASAATGLIVLGFDARQKPCGARFVDAKPALVVKAAQLMGLRVYKVTSRDVAAAAKKLPLGQLYANGRAFVPHVRQSLYSDVIAALSYEPQQAAVGPHPDKASTPAPVACRATGTRSRRAISSSCRRAPNTAGPRPSCSTAPTTCSPCSTGITRSCPSSFATAPRWR